MMVGAQWVGANAGVLSSIESFIAWKEITQVYTQQKCRYRNDWQTLLQLVVVIE